MFYESDTHKRKRQYFMSMIERSKWIDLDEWSKQRAQRRENRRNSKYRHCRIGNITLKSA